MTCTCRSLDCTSCTLARFGPLPDAQPYIDAEAARRRSRDIARALDIIGALEADEATGAALRITELFSGGYEVEHGDHSAYAATFDGCILALAAAIEGRQ